MNAGLLEYGVSLTQVNTNMEWVLVMGSKYSNPDFLDEVKAYLIFK